MKNLKQYTVKQKLRFIEIANKIGVSKISSLIGIHQKCIKLWKKNQEKLEKIKDKDKSFRLKGGGAKPKTLEIEDQIVEFIKKCRSINYNVTTGLIIDELCRIKPEMLYKSRKALRNWCYRFLKRHNYP